MAQKQGVSGNNVAMPNLTSWIRQVMDKGSEKRARKIANYVCNTPLAERDQAMDRVLHELARNRAAFLNHGWQEGLQLITRYLADCSLELRDYTFLNAIYSSQVATRPTPKQYTCLELVMCYFRYIAADDERTRAFCRVMFTDLAEQLAPALSDGSVGLRRWLGDHTPLMVSIIWESVYCPAHQDSPSKQWFVNLVRMYAETKDAELLDWLETVYILLTVRHADVRVFDQAHLEMFLRNAGISMTQYLTGTFDPTMPIIVLPIGMTDAFEAFLQGMDRRNGEVSETAREWSRWFMYYAPRMATDQAAMRDAVTTQPNRLVRPDGQDCVDVSQLTVFRDLGIRHIRFYPNGSPWPEMGVQFEICPYGCLTTTVAGALTATGLSVPDALFEQCYPEDRPHRRRILEYIVWDSLYRLVVNCENHSGEHVPARSGNGHTRQWNGYAPHWVTLPDGKHASHAAIDRCLQLFQFQPPAGKTFNRGCAPEADGQTVEVRPRLVFTDALLSGG